MKKEGGNVGELLSAALCLLAMTVMLMSYMDCIQVIQQKLEISQVARQYILRMETVGSLSSPDYQKLCQELRNLGVDNLSLDGTTTRQVSYGEEIMLQIRGELSNGYEFSEKKVSTAKY